MLLIKFLFIFYFIQLLNLFIWYLLFTSEKNNISFEKYYTLSTFNGCLLEKGLDIKALIKYLLI